MEEQLSSSSVADSPQRCGSCNQTSLVTRPLVSPTLKEALIRVAKVKGKTKKLIIQPVLCTKSLSVVARVIFVSEDTFVGVWRVCIHINTHFYRE